MSIPTIIGDILSDAWNALTADQRSCWHFFAMKNPIIDEEGELTTLNGWQIYYRQNVYIAIGEDYALLEDPPANLDPPPTRTLQATLWSAKGLLASGATTRRSTLVLEVKQALSADAFEILTQGYTENHGGPPIPAHPSRTTSRQRPSPRHVTILEPLFTGIVDLQTPTGYFATTGGRAKFSTIKGITARRRPDLPAAKLRAVSLLNGQTAESTVLNAAGFARATNPILNPLPVIDIDHVGSSYKVAGLPQSFMTPGRDIFAVGGTHPGERLTIDHVTTDGTNTLIFTTTTLNGADNSTYIRPLRA
jgi:hypothetical protein